MEAIGASTWIWTSPLSDEVLAGLAPRLSRWGFDVVELPVEAVGDWDPVAAADILAQAALTATVCAVMGPGRELVATDSGTVAATQDYLRACVDHAVAVGATVVGGPLYASVGRCWRMDDGERADVLRELHSALRPVCEYAGERGVRLAVEPLNRYETSVLNTVAQTLEAIDPLPAETCGVLADVYHLNIEERDPAAAIRSCGDRLAHVHVCANDRGAPGADHLDWPGLIGACRASGYRGPLVIESFTADQATIATAASVWRPLADDQDALAVDGLSFLRTL